MDWAILRTCLLCDYCQCVGSKKGKGLKLGLNTEPAAISFFHILESWLIYALNGYPNFFPLTRKVKVKMKSLSHVRLFTTQWIIAYQAPQSMGFSRQEYWSGLPFPSPGDSPDPGIEPESLALQADTLPSEPSYLSLVWSLI